MADYMTGFGNMFSTESEPGAIPKDQNNPQKHERGLFAEQISGSSFLAVGSENLRTWFYRKKPSVVHSGFKKRGGPHFSDERFKLEESINQLRWDPIGAPSNPIDFLEGLFLYAQNGSPQEQCGSAIYLYSFSKSMEETYFYSADGEWLFVPQAGALELRTEMGILEIAPLEIAVIPRGVKFQIKSKGACTGYICENFGLPMRLPHLGPIGSNGLASPRHFLYPTAWSEEKTGHLKTVAKYQGTLWEAPIESSPLDVVGWYGNYAPYKYDLRLFNTINTVSFDHPDPSIFTVLTSPTERNGFSNVDFVIFPPRWMVAENTFRPPYFHRNFMSEFMGLIKGAYDAKKEGFLPGGASLHNSMTPHGPDKSTYDAAVAAELKPHFIKDTMAFMFESRYPFKVSQFALQRIQKNYIDCWKGF